MNYLDIVLEDDSPLYGGVAFRGETLRDFLESVNMELDASLFEINRALKNCGIKTIKEKI